MEIGPKDLIERFYESIKKDYPQFSLEDVSQICRAPFTFVKRAMSSTAVLPTIRFKYFGVFKINLRKAVAMLRVLNKALETKRLSRERYDELQPNLIAFIKEHKNYSKLKAEDVTKIEEQAQLLKGTLPEEHSSLHTGEPEV